MDDLPQAVAGERGEHDMHMIGHDTPRPDSIAPAVKVAEGAGDNSGNARISQEASAQSLVQAALGLAEQLPELFETVAIGWDGGARPAGPLQQLALFSESSRELAGKRIGQAESDEIIASLAFQVRQVAARAQRHIGYGL